MLKKFFALLPHQLAETHQNRPLRFFLAGILNSIFGFFVYTLAIVFTEKIWLALLASVCAGIVFNFFTTGGFVFRDNSIQRVPRFAGCYFFIYITNYALINALSYWIDNVIISQALLTPFIAILSYFLMAHFVFPQSKGSP